MSVLLESEIQAYTSRLNGLSDATQKVVKASLSNIEFDSVAELREKLIEVLNPFCNAAAEMAGAIASDFYDSTRMNAIGEAYGADPNPMRNSEATEGAIRAIVQRVVNGETLDDIVPQLLERVDYEIKRAAGNCVMNNSMDDSECGGFARIPTGSETCGFCLMLASRGFTYRTRDSAGGDDLHGTMLDHYHANCDCRIVPGFNGQEVEGYDPDDLYWKWHDSEHAEYMKRKADDELARWLEDHEHTKKRERDSKYKIDGTEGKPSFKNFNDVKDYLYKAKSMKDLDKRFNDLSIMYGPTSEQMRSRSLLNVRKTAEKRLKQ